MVVDSNQHPNTQSSHSTANTRDNDHRCQPPGVGSTLSTRGTGSLVLSPTRYSFKHSGTQGCLASSLNIQPLLTGRNVLLRMDNTVAVNYIHRQGGTRSNTLMEEVRPIIEWAQVHLMDLKVIYISAVQKQLADDLSRIFISNNEWSLNLQVFALLTRKWGIPDMDLAATPENSKCSRFLSRATYPTAAGIDCLHHPWSFHLGYIFPPISLIARFLARLRRWTSIVIAVLPFWPRRPWFATILQLNTEEPFPLPVTPDLLSRPIPSPIT